MTYQTDTGAAYVRVNSAQTNMIVDPASANVSDIPALTGVTIDDGVTNITRTNQAGFFETRPINLTMIPLIRY